MAKTAYEALEEMLHYIRPVWGREVRLQSRHPEYWDGFNRAVDLGYIEENKDIRDGPYRREFRLLRKGFNYAKSVGLISDSGHRAASDRSNP